MDRRTQAKNDLIKLLTDEINKPVDKKREEMIAIDKLISYKNHPFKLYEGERFWDMVRSIREMGILLPIIVRPADSYKNQYEILSGHNRVKAAREAGIIEVPAIIKQGLSDEEAELIVTETNLVQRSFADLQHSERAIALKRHLNAIKHQGKRTDLISEINSILNADKNEEGSTSNLIDKKKLSVEKTGSKYGLSSASVARYIRLNYLNKELQGLVDKEEVGIYAAVSLSYLLGDEQIALNKILEEKKYKVDMKKAEMLRSYSENKKLSEENMILVLSGEHSKKRKSKSGAAFKLKQKIYSKYFDGSIKQEEVERIIDKALEEYFRVHEKKSMQ